MVDAHRKEAWQHTSAVLATLANIHRDPKKKPRPFRPSDFQPSTQPQPTPMKSSIHILKRVFVERG